MRQELQQKLYNKYPLIFQDKDKSMQETCMCWGIDCSDGWYWLLDSLCDSIQSYINCNSKKKIIKNKVVRYLITKLNSLPWKLKRRIGFKTINKIKDKFQKIEIETISQVVASQVKEKYGRLRFYIEGGNELTDGMIWLAEHQSYSICEYCGTTQNVGYTRGWVSTICKDCHSKIDNRKDLIWKQNET